MTRRNRAVRPRGLRLETLERRQLLAGELTELNALDWSAWGDGATLAAVADDTARTVVGAAALRFETDGGFDTYVQYPGTADADWDLTSENYLQVAFYAENSNAGFQSGSPWIQLVDGEGEFFTYQYYQDSGAYDLLQHARGTWRFYQIPLDAPEKVEHGWGRTAAGTPDMSDIRYLQIHADTWEHGFTLWIDGLFFSATADPLVVTNTGDDGPGSLRSALETANTVNYAATIQFNIPTTDAGFVDVDAHLLGLDPRADADPDAYVIQPLTPLPPLENHVQGTVLDGRTQALFGGDTNPFGPEIVLDGSRLGPWQDGLVINTSGHQVRGLNVCNAPNHGLTIRGEGNRVEGNYVGTDATGTLAARNGNAGILIENASHNTLGGTAPGAGNVISANGGHGIWISAGQEIPIFHWAGQDGDSDRYYLVTPASTWAESNATAAALGGQLLAVNAQAEQDFLEAEVLARDEYWYESFWTGLNDAAIEETFVWTSGEPLTFTNWDADTQNSPFDDHVWINGSQDYPDHRGKWFHVPGDWTAQGIVELGALPDRETVASLFAAGHNVVQGNRIGTDPSGALDLGNGADGVYVDSSFNTIGGPQSGAGNVVSGNGWSGVEIRGRYAVSNLVAGNRIGTDADGAAAVPNQAAGIVLAEASGNVVGGVEGGAGNLVSGNLGHGINLGGSEIRVYHWPLEGGGNGHYYLLSPWGPWRETKTAAAAVDGYLVTVTSLAEQTFLDQNIFSADAYWNESFWTGLHDHQDEGQFVWTSGEALGFENWTPGQPDGGIEENAAVINSGQDYPNHRGQWSDVPGGWGFRGIIELDSAPDWPLVVSRLGAHGNSVQGNLVGPDQTGDSDLGNGGAGIAIDHSAWNTIGGATLEARNVVSGNRWDGVRIYGHDSLGNAVTGNYLGTNADGSAGLGNSGAGVAVNDARGTVIGGSATGAGNVISGNGVGVSISGSSAAETSLLGNLIGTDVSGVLPIGNSGQGVVIDNAPDNTIGGASPGAGNVIAASGWSGLEIYGGAAADNVIQGNAIGTNWAGATGLGNGQDGIRVNDSPGTRILDNVISANPRGISLVGSERYLGQWTDPAGDEHYYVLGPQKTWAQAEALAQSIGGHLAEITSAAEQRYLQNLLGWDAAWIGLTDEATEGVFTWSSGAPLSYTNWAPGSPQLAGGDYGMINREPGDPERRGRWCDAQDTLARALIEVLNPADPLSLVSRAAETFAGAGSVIQGNKIGTTPDGAAALGNGQVGIYVGNSSHNVIGLDSPGAGAGNVIAANGQDGIQINDRWSVGNSIRGNRIGTTADGAKALGNGWSGISVSSPAGAVIGGSASGLGNVISGNAWNGVVINGDSYLVAEHGGRHYVVTPPRTWFEAEAAAVALGGHVATISDPAENAFVASLAQGRYAGTLWIGLTDQAQQDAWGWVSGEAGTYANWQAGQPDHGGAANFEHYAAINSDSTGAWSDWDGRSGFRAVLEFNSPPSISDLDALFASGHTQVLSNRIGTDAAGVSALGNGASGVAIDHSQFNTIGGTLAISHRLPSRGRGRSSLTKSD